MTQAANRSASMVAEEHGRLDRLEMVVSEIDAQIHHMAAVVYSKAQENVEPDSPQEGRAPMRDEVWACENCCARLGIYNEAKDELRVRYKDFVAYIKPGKGGTVMVPCRRCGEQNSLNDTRTTNST
jgi:hypothetical protein